MEDLSKGFKIKKAYATSKGDINNTEKDYDDLVLNNKTINDVFYQDVYKEFSKIMKIFFKKQKSCLIRGLTFIKNWSLREKI